jgi:PAT family beta-lactamase induction signal transducer AmpG
MLVAKLGLLRSIVIGAIIQLLSPFTCAWLAVVGHSIPALVATTTVQNLACGLGSTVLIIYVSSLCKKDGTTATQYALIYSFSSLSRTVLSSISGFCAAYTNWSTFFVVTTLIGLPVFLIIKKLSVAPLSVAARE